jgi:hypothetical protein
VGQLTVLPSDSDDFDGRAGTCQTTPKATLHESPFRTSAGARIVARRRAKLAARMGAPGRCPRVPGVVPLPVPSDHPPANAGAIRRDAYAASDGRRRADRSRSPTATYAWSRPRGYLIALQLDPAGADAQFWVYRPVKRSFPDTSGRKPLRNPGLAGVAIGFKSPSSHSRTRDFAAFARRCPATAKANMAGRVGVCDSSGVHPSELKNRAPEQLRPKLCLLLNALRYDYIAITCFTRSTADPKRMFGTGG